MRPKTKVGDVQNIHGMLCEFVGSSASPHSCNACIIQKLRLKARWCETIGTAAEIPDYASCDINSETPGYWKLVTEYWGVAL